MNKEKTTVENALIMFQNNLKGDVVIILEAINNKNPEENHIYCEFYSAKKLLKFLHKNYGKWIIEFDLYYKLINQ